LISANGGNGGGTALATAGSKSSDTLSVTAGETLNIFVGGGGGGMGPLFGNNDTKK
jgi:hypothetical protein